MAATRVHWVAPQIWPQIRRSASRWARPRRRARGPHHGRPGPPRPRPGDHSTSSPHGASTGGPAQSGRDSSRALSTRCPSYRPSSARSTSATPPRAPCAAAWRAGSTTASSKSNRGASTSPRSRPTMIWHDRHHLFGPFPHGPPLASAHAASNHPTGRDEQTPAPPARAGHTRVTTPPPTGAANIDRQTRRRTTRSRRCTPTGRNGPAMAAGRPDSAHRCAWPAGCAWGHASAAAPDLRPGVDDGRAASGTRPAR